MRPAVPPAGTARHCHPAALPPRSAPAAVRPADPPRARPGRSAAPDPTARCQGRAGPAALPQLLARLRGPRRGAVGGGAARTPIASARPRRAGSVRCPHGAARRAQGRSGPLCAGPRAAAPARPPSPHLAAGPQRGAGGRWARARPARELPRSYRGICTGKRVTERRYTAPGPRSAPSPAPPTAQRHKMAASLRRRHPPPGRGGAEGSGGGAGLRGGAGPSAAPSRRGARGSRARGAEGALR